MTISKNRVAPGSCFRIRVRSPERSIWHQGWSLERRVEGAWRPVNELIVYPNKHFFQFRPPGFDDYFHQSYGGDDTVFARLPLLEDGRYRFVQEFAFLRDGQHVKTERADTQFNVVGEPVIRSKERCRRPDYMRL